MLSLPSPRADERAADQLDDLASGLDAGLRPDQLGLLPPAQATAGDDLGMSTLLAERGVQLKPAEQHMLDAAGRAGRLPSALRERAAARRQRAELSRRVWAGLRYPMVLLAVGLAVSIITGIAFGSRTPIFVAGALIALVVAGLILVHRSIRRPGGLATRLPWLGAVLRDLGEVPYLQALHGLYAAGVPLLQAHPKAVDAIPVATVRIELYAADRLLQQNVSLAESLAKTGAAHSETRALLATGEKAGDLEGALRRAAQRRQDVMQRSVDNLVRRGTTVVYVLAVALAVFVIFSFYSGYVGQLSRAWR